MQLETQKEIKETYRVISYLTKKQVQKLDQLGHDALFTTGKKLPRSVIVGLMVELLLRLDVNAEGVDDQYGFWDKVWLQWQKSKKLLN